MYIYIYIYIYRRILTSTYEPVSFIAVLALTAETAGWVGARGVQVTGVVLGAALVDVRALESVQTGVPDFALTHVRPRGVNADRGVHVAVVSVLASHAGALVDI